ncbi:bifunctional 3-(3-hydroxy-phenyl)propionate/3-hydroxycinnamic acid hydroxylase [Nocardia alni]|uniref:bifunctional 3-(3-hydroxy-phenyl)propionate/3-hydroxycinnamic acid hydroxylase n=1 Tax=Nocardia alni TaxID=2815723 RepID=UPI001C24D8C6|nr:bifunctional 3-(3-hydroxy-phenyl)propionate/3-hydroxycinnamic acid hydroxylase [Nocardia alni]
MTDVDVVVVGYGPGGEMLASLLGRAGHRVLVFEQFPEPYGLPRMSTLDGEIARLLQHASDASKALEDSLPQPYGYMYGADDKLAVRHEWDFTLCGHPSHLSLHQPNIEAAMDERIASFANVEVRWGTTVTSVDDLGDAVRVTARTSVGTGSEATEQQVTARYVVGMDGANSTVRNTLGIDVDVIRQHDDQWFLTDFDILDPAIAEPATEIHMDPRQPYYWGPNGARRCRTDVKVVGNVDPSTQLDHEHGYAWLENRIGIPRNKVRITRRVLYRFRSQIAASFRKGRIFLGGDAAHAMTPHMAQGSCSAMRDGANISWKFDLVLRGLADESLLDSYETERMKHVLPFIHGSLAAWAATSEENPDAAAQRDAFMRSGNFTVPPIPPLPDGILQRDESGAVRAPAGSLSPQGVVVIDSREALLDDIVGFGFQLVTTVPLDEVLKEPHRQLLEAIGAHVVVLGDGPGQTRDVEGTYRDFLGAHGATAYLSRPDLYLFGIADGAAATADLVAELGRQLSLVETTADRPDLEEVAL